MCGIAGIYSAGDKSAIEPMTRVLAHRGPDNEGFFRDDYMALGHRRLSINDLETGDQPIASADGRLQLICNGEIYNSPELRRLYQNKGYQFKTRSDVEVILPLYLEHGKNCVRYLQGMFAFVVWDAAERTVLLARDHMGQKPLFYSFDGERLLFASEPKGILASGAIRREVDLDGLWHYISLRYIPDRLSLFRNIAKLEAGTTLLLRGGRIEIDRYWRPDFRRKHPGSEEEVGQALDGLLRSTVKSHLLSDVQVGAFLSGGLDSSTIAAMIAEQTDEPLSTFSIGVEEQGFNELPYARMVAQQYGMRAHEKVVRADLIHLIPEMVYHLDEPSDPFAAGVYLVAREAARHVKVVLTGDGGDENFAGYDRYAGNQLVGMYAMLPQWFRRAIMARCIEAIPESFAYKSLRQKARWFNQMSFFEDGRRYAESMSFLRFTQDAKQSLLTASARRQVSDEDSIQKILDYFDADNVEHVVDRMLYTDLMTRMPDHLLSIVDRMTMAHSLESRAPLVDYKVVEYAAGIPAPMKLKGRDLKHMFKRVAGRYLPDELITREKQGFGFPLALWMRTSLQPFIRNLFAESRFVELGLFDRQFMSQLAEEHFAGKADHNFRLWILINLEVWYRLAFENETRDSMRGAMEALSEGAVLKVA